MSKKTTHQKHHAHNQHHNHNLTHDPKIVSKKNKVLNSIVTNPWAISTIVLAVVLIVLFSTNYASFGSSSSDVQIQKITASEAEKIVVDFAEKQGLTATVKSTEMESGLYKVNIEIQGQEVPVYLTPDGKNLVPTVLPLADLTKQAEKSNPSKQPTPTNVPKSDKPKVELFVMSHCPFGTQIEKGIIPVAEKLGDKIDFEIKFVNYAMHPSKGEVQEELNQYCIQRDYNDKYLDYLSAFLEKGDGDAALSTVGLTKDDIKSCVEETDKKYDITKNLEDKSSWASGRFPKFMIHDEENQKYGVRGSPTLVINGEQVQSGRDAQSLLDTICSSFNNKPAECDTDFSSLGNPAPGFGFESQGGSATTAGCGA